MYASRVGKNENHYRTIISNSFGSCKRKPRVIQREKNRPDYLRWKRRFQETAVLIFLSEIRYDRIMIGIFNFNYFKKAILKSVII